MTLKYSIYYAALDIIQMGPRFFLQGLRARAQSGSVNRIDVPGAGHMYVRAGDSDFESVRQVFRGEEYSLVIKAVDERVRRKYLDILSSGRTPVIIDAGANIGAASRWFAQRYPEATVVSIEPDPGNFEILRKNCQGKSIRPIEAAVGSEQGYVSVHNDGHSWGVQTTRSQSGVRIVTMDDAVGTVENGELFIAKVDIEGFESDLFASNTEWIDRAFVIYVEPHDWLLPGKRTSGTFQREISRRDFEVFINRENLIFVRQV